MNDEQSARVTVVVGNPKRKSRTLDAAELVARKLTGEHPRAVFDLVELGASLLSWSDSAVSDAVEVVCRSDVAVVASPTFKASFTGLLKLFLDQIPGNGLSGVVAVPLMLGAGPHHALVPELQLKPVLVELGATCPARALYLIDSSYRDDGQLDQWVNQAGPTLRRLLRRPDGDDVSQSEQIRE